MIGTLAEFSTYLADAQARRVEAIRCELSPALSARMNDAALTEALICGLPMARGISRRILRSRGQGVILTAKLRYRDGVRMLWCEPLNTDESAALDMARCITADFLPLDEEERFRQVYRWVCRNIRYAHTAPGQKGYEQLVSAKGALLNRQANCQGFADVLYLLCRLCSIECEYRIGKGEKRLHMWNAVRINGTWQEVDASKGSRLPTV